MYNHPIQKPLYPRPLPLYLSPILSVRLVLKPNSGVKNNIKFLPSNKKFLSNTFNKNLQNHQLTKSHSPNPYVRRNS